MTQSNQKAPYYPKSHLLAASGVAALLSLALLVFPSSEVEAKKTTLNLELDGGSDRIIQEKDDLRSPQVTENSDSPFARIEGQNDDNRAGKDAEEEKKELKASNDTQPATPAEPAWKRVTVGKGDTLSTVFAKAGLPAGLVHDVLASSKDAKQFTRLDVGHEVELLISPQGELQSLRIKQSDLETISLNKSAKGYAFKRDLVKPDVHTAYAHGRIDSSLFTAGKEAGLSHDLIMALANIFGYDIDFALDLREGDQFDVIYEKKVVNGRQVDTGNILAARFINRGKEYTAVRFTNKTGNTSYYRADGTSMRKAFIRTPVDFARISSRFSMGRLHPILNKIRAHKGVDYAAPIGTPIKATGDGKVLEAGRKGGYGNAVVIQHGSTYQTVYGHMSRFAKGIRSGVAVKQGQIIGYVGMTGLATGPHLHYEFHVNGQYVDPLSAKLPMADPLAGPDRKRFLAQTQPLMARMDQEKPTSLAMNKQQEQQR
ncbi:murein DD-endopeptidase MepM/ murein hydrolase activator NlpD [Pseudomonas citronellolis]|uniref:peptidoglycan DD-metalloendopeptidase family protein n=1 Tax=Pseudomonas citronellolis TaxID=53408 RepID=UPI00209FF618|nr:peptidoglycan DD-metalloendopeptidase family protein [Pseudomonas citronellolis]MCP1646455.1 murein DD-endopeptidase MepM/ murein hydrolase activator NlpD [Pseudomonas citronellolis]MCP1669407.1 murein DD-endopeptidase MepM/ murein hydrolase activator NlpD [Pseudomonas citronellolis]MCP1701087.1 murein DD-endopeptidase MepM/ murein hydrolase activator NlpD [Pseudomonas citronellolis]MCP1707264.1 murein DD-endopeptidase MepM/ murein hydrolase activator NlpD [Pseudomonas citronellolis]MCP1801